MKNIYTNLARKSIYNYLKTGKFLNSPKSLPKNLTKRAGTFISLHLSNDDLRGCIGTFLATQPNLAEEIIKNAVAAATSDPRFEPVTLSELKSIEISVDVLSSPKPVQNPDRELNPKKYGVIVKTADGRSGLLLPDLDGVDSANQQIAIASQKAGIIEGEPVFLYKFTVKRHEE
ncbi:MAG TPA: AmmeMemoRadiSam system protein A [Patescibacteria group bacterium]|nr:AmmeMemoRadiSam system protein A [Patescibacteria group bacterium]